MVVNKNPNVCRIYLPPDVNTLLSVADQHGQTAPATRTSSTTEQKHLQYMTMDEAIAHGTKGIGIWAKASNDEGKSELERPRRSPAMFPPRKAWWPSSCCANTFQLNRFVNVVDLYRLVPSTEHPHGLSDRDFDSLFTKDKPIDFNFHGYPWLIHRLTYRRTNHHNLHVRGYKEKGNINTPLDLAIQNQIRPLQPCHGRNRYRVPSLQTAGAHAKVSAQCPDRCQGLCHEHGIDKPSSISGHGQVDPVKLNVWKMNKIRPCGAPSKKPPSPGGRLTISFASGRDRCLLRTIGLVAPNSNGLVQLNDTGTLPLRTEDQLCGN